MAERLTHYITEGDFVSSIPHPFNTVLHQKPHLEPWFLKTIELYESGRFSAIEEAPVLANLAFIDNPANVALVAEGYKVEPPVVTSWINQAYDRPHLQEVIDEASREKGGRLHLREGTPAFQKQAFVELFQESIVNMPENLLSDVERLIVEDSQCGITNEQIAKKYNYANSHSIEAIIGRVRSRIENVLLSPVGITRASRHRGKTDKDRIVRSRIAAAVQQGRLPGIKYLHKLYTHQTYIDAYERKRATYVDPDLFDQGYVWLGDRDVISKEESDKLVTRKRYEQVLLRQNNRTFILAADLDRVRDGSIAHSSPVPPPTAEHTWLRTLADDDSLYHRAKNAVNSGILPGVKVAGEWIFVLKEDFTKFVDQLQLPGSEYKKIHLLTKNRNERRRLIYAAQTGGLHAIQDGNNFWYAKTEDVMDFLETDLEEYKG
jgi:hypothetical protein